MSLSSRFRNHIRNNVVGYVALFFALGGSAAWAAHEVIESSDVVDNSLTHLDLKNNVGVLTQDVRDDSFPNGGLQGVDIRPNTLTGADIDEATFSTSPSGPAGGDLGGSYPNPTLAPGSVGTSEITNGSLDAADVGKAAGVTRIDFGSIAAGRCAGFSVFPGVSPDGEAIVVTPSEEFDNNGILATSAMDSNVAGAFGVVACNVTGAAIDPPSANFSWIVFDN